MHSDEQAAADISTYLLTGMHHSTPEGRAAIALIIRKRDAEARAKLSQRARDERISAICAGRWYQEMQHKARAEVFDELSRQTG